VKKPIGLTYGVNDPVPALVGLLSGLQHIGLISSYLVYPILVFRLAGLATQDVAELLAIGFVVLGVATLLQANSRGPVGSGFLCPVTYTAAFLGPSLGAVKLGGLPLLFGMTVFAGVVESALSRVLHKLRPFLPTELSGFVVLMAGVTAGVAGTRFLVGTGGAPSLTGLEWAIAGATLAIMAGLSVWASGLLKMTCVLVGMLVGYAAAAAGGLLGKESLAAVASAPSIALPTLSHAGLAFDAAMVVPFLVASIAAALKAMGSVALAHRMNDADWVRPKMSTNRRGVLADGMGTVLAGFAGAYGTNTSAANVALAGATGVASRRVAWAIAGIFVALGFLPQLAMLFAIMPRPVMAAALIFTTCFLLLNGMQIITSRMLDSRRILVIGLGTVAGLAVEIVPAIASAVPAAIAPLFGSSLVFGTLVALGLNMVFRLGVGRSVTLVVDPAAADHAKAIEDFYAANGAAWGARPDVVARASFGTQQLVEALIGHCDPRGPLALEVSFDEYRLDVRVTYEGGELAFPEQRPTNDEIRESEEGMRRLAGYMLRRNADRVSVRESDGRVTVHFHFDH
jgi:NCS2 family nucleobase:cation symporter-2